MQSWMDLPMKRTASLFKRIGKEIWHLASAVDEPRRHRLLSGMRFDQIVCRILGSARLAAYVQEVHCCKKDFCRAVIRLEMESELVDLFHNSASGYRAQYYYGVRAGEQANQYAVKTLVPHIMELLAAQENLTSPLWWVKKSLMARQAKLWIHQGRWLHNARMSDRNLQLQRWIDNLNSSDASTRKKARWGSLAPMEETKIELKGAFLMLDGTPLAGIVKPSRARDIRDFGFT